MMLAPAGPLRLSIFIVRLEFFISLEAAEGLKGRCHCGLVDVAVEVSGGIAGSDGM